MSEEIKNNVEITNIENNTTENITANEAITKSEPVLNVQNPEEKPRKKNKLIENAKKFGEKIINIFRDYPVTMIAIVIASVIAAILEDYPNNAALDDKWLIRAIGVLLILSVQSLFIEEILPEKTIPRIIGYFISAAVAVAYVAVLSTENDIIFGTEVDKVCENLVKFLSVHMTILFCLTIRHMYLRLEDDFEVYVSKAFLELIKSTFIYGLFAIGLGIIIGIFNELIYDTDDFIWQFETFLAGGIYAPMCIKAIARKNDEPGKFSRVCFIYVLQPMLIISFVIIYLYIFKLIILREILSNAIFGILTFLFCVGLPIWTVVHSMKQKEGLLSKITTILPYVFIPFLALQIWAISIRIGDYGLTVERYFCIIVVIVEVIYFVLYLLHHKGNKKAISYMLYVIMTLTAICLIVPFVNFNDAVINSQIKRMKAMMADPEENDSSLSSAYRTVYWAGYKGKEALEKAFTEDELDEISENSGYDFHDYVYIYGSVGRYGDIDISGYNTMYYIDDYGNYKIENGKVYMIAKQFGEVKEEYDITDYIYDIQDSYNERNAGDFELGNNNIIDVDKDTRLILTYLSMSYDEKDRDINSFSIDCYVLKK